METEEYSPERRDEQFEVLKVAQKEVLNLTNWHQFLKCLIGAGFRSNEMISSQTAILYSYAIYLIGRNKFKVPEYKLQSMIGRWFYASTLSGRYSGAACQSVGPKIDGWKSLIHDSEPVKNLRRVGDIQKLGFNYLFRCRLP